MTSSSEKTSQDSDERVLCDRCLGDGVIRPGGSTITECTKCLGWGWIRAAYLDQKPEGQQDSPK